MLPNIEMSTMDGQKDWGGERANYILELYTNGGFGDL